MAGFVPKANKIRYIGNPHNEAYLSVVCECPGCGGGSWLNSGTAWGLAAQCEKEYQCGRCQTVYIIDFPEMACPKIEGNAIIWKCAQLGCSGGKKGIPLSDMGKVIGCPDCQHRYKVPFIQIPEQRSEEEDVLAGIYFQPGYSIRDEVNKSPCPWCKSKNPSGAMVCAHCARSLIGKLPWNGGFGW